MRTLEDWKVYKFGKGFDDDYQLLFSNFGEVKSCTKSNPEGNIINGSLRDGYPIISFTQYKPISEANQSIFELQEDNIKLLREENRNLKKIARRKTTPKKDLIKIRKEIAKIEKTIKKNLNQLSKQRKEEKKTRAIHIHLLAHKAVAELFIPNDDPKNKKFVIHKNYDKTDNRVENLSWATQQEVIERSQKSPNYIRHTINRPKRDPNIVAKLTRNEVVLIKRKLEKGEPMSRLAKRFGVSDMQIYRIKTGEHWADVKMSLSE